MSNPRARQLATRPLTFIFYFLFSIFGASSAFALDPSLDISQYAHTAWKLRDGFTKGATYSIAQTPDGYLWLGTEFGLVRFDGVHATPWQPPRDQYLPPGSILCLLVARDGTLWIGARGLASWKNGKLTHYAELADQYVFALREDGEGTIWAGTDARPYGRLCAIRNGTILCYGQDGILGLGVTTLYEDGKGELWAGVYNGLWRWKPGIPKFYPVPSDRNGIRAINEDADGTILIGWQSGPRTGYDPDAPTASI